MVSTRVRSVVFLVALLLTFAHGATPTSAEDYVAKAYDKREPFGVVASLGNSVRDEEQDEAVSLMQEAGVQWAREEISWDRLQRERGGPYLWNGDGSGFGNYDASIGRMHDAGINILGLLAYNPAWFKSKNPVLDEWITDWGDYVYNTVARYGRDRGQIKYWEIWNEPNLRRFGYENTIYTIHDYVRVLDVARAAAKSADPEAVIVLGGVASIWGDLVSPEDYDVPSYLQMLHDAGGWNSFDVLAIHPYRPGPPEASSWRRDTAQDFEAELRTVDGLLAAFGDKPVWITEVSWSAYSGPYGVSETDQAAFLQRMYAIAMSHPSVQRVFWYNLRNATTATAYDQPHFADDEAEYHFGLLRRTFPLDPKRDDLRKPAFVAYRMMTEVLSGMAPDGVLAYGDNPAMPGTFAQRYSDGGRGALVMWRVHADAGPALTLPCDCRDARVRQWDGKLLAVVQSEGTLTVRLDTIGLPIFVEWGEDRIAEGEFFAETGHHVAEPFLQYWRNNGGPEQFGYPLTGALIEPGPGGKPRPTQYFERNRLEFYPEQAGTPGAIQAGRLGEELLQSMGVDWSSLPRQTEAAPNCLAFAETGHTICPPFRDYWERNGGLAKFGLPLTEAYDENGILVQYFERTRLERNPAAAGTPREIQPGRLGSALYERTGSWP